MYKTPCTPAIKGRMWAGPSDMETVLCAERPDWWTFYQEHLGGSFERRRHLGEVVRIRPGTVTLQWLTKFNILLQALLEGEGEEHRGPSSM